MKHLTIVVAVTLLLSPTGLGGPYQVAYEGDVFPEQDGWDRFTSGGGVDRTIQGGVFQLSTEDPSTADSYVTFRNGQLDAGPGEMFYAEWRMRLLPTSVDANVIVYVARDNEHSDVKLAYGIDQITSFFDGNFIFIDTTVFRTYRIVSFDMVNYDFFIDEDLFYTGFFDTPAILDSLVRFGDCCIPGASSSEWDYFRFGVSKLGDVNLDGSVNLLDFAAFATCFDAATVKPPPSCSALEAYVSDLNQDGVINLSDFATFAVNFDG